MNHENTTVTSSGKTNNIPNTALLPTGPVRALRNACVPLPTAS